MDSRFNGVSAIVAVVMASVYIVIIVLAIVAYARIIRRTGYSGWWVFSMFVPVLNLVMFVLFAVKEWPIERRLTDAEARAAYAGAYAQPLPMYRTPPAPTYLDMPYPAGYGPPPPPAPAQHGAPPVPPQSPNGDPFNTGTSALPGSGCPTGSIPIYGEEPPSTRRTF